MNAAALPFLTALDGAPADAPALFDDASTAWLTYGELRERVNALSLSLSKNTARPLTLCCLPRTIDGVIAYLAAAKAGHAIILADPEAPNLDAIIDAYHPDWVIATDNTSFQTSEPRRSAKREGRRCADLESRRYVVHTHEMRVNALHHMTKLRFAQACQLDPGSSFTLRDARRSLVRDDEKAAALHPDFYLLLLTSGSTGSHKGVRLSYGNIAANTRAIIKSLNLTASETALCHLPLSYSFGLSVLHTQLAARGRCLLTEKSMMDSTFWQLAREQEATLFAGVPYHYEMLMRLGLARLKLPKLTTFLQAGGKMHVPLAQKALSEIQRREDGKLFIMYGQTEASPRISSFPLHLYPEKIGSSGTALDGTHLEIADGEIIVNGPHVMMGYANNRDDLALGDVMHGRLPTGDLGALDKDGYVTITGRKQRFAKLFGQRIALDDLEKIASPLATCIAIEHPEKIVLFAVCADEATLAEIKQALTEQTKLPAPWIDVRAIETLPTKTNGKTDYQALQGMVV